MYRVAIKIEGIERRKRSTGLLHIVAGLFLMANASQYYKLMAYQNFLSVFPILLVGVISVVYGLLRKRLDVKAQFNHWVRMLQVLTFSILGILMLESDVSFRNILLLLWAVVCILLLFTERKVFHDASLSFTKTNIIIPGYFINRTLPWSVIENIVIRPDYVTIYQPANRYQQYEVLGNLSAEEIKNINQFCKQQLEQKEAVQED